MAMTIPGKPAPVPTSNNVEDLIKGITARQSKK